MKIAHEEVWKMPPAMASLIGVQCVTVQELTAHAPVEKRVLAVQKRALEEPEEVVHRNAPPVEKRVLADEKTAHEGPSNIGTAISSFIGVQCVTVEELIAHAPVEKEVLANEMRPMKS